MITITVAGTNSSVGKTTVTNALLLGLKNPRAFKSGVDFIDPSYYRHITKEKVYNLDLFSYGEEKLKYVFNRYKKEVNIVEGVMGMFSGLSHKLDNYSTAHISRVLNSKVLLVVDGSRQDTSINAIVKGFIEYDKRVKVQGVLLNNVTEGMYNYLKNALQEIDVKVYGYIPKLEEYQLPERHLGLHQASELDNLDHMNEYLHKITKKTIDFEELKKDFTHQFTYVGKDYFEEVKDKLKNKKVTIIKDEAFSFIYDMHIDLLEHAGAKIKYVSALHDNHIDGDTLFIPGGYPELYQKQLINNHPFIESLKNFKGQIIAECGGYMYLSKRVLIDGENCKMVGLIDDELEMTNKLDIKHFGYIEAIVSEHHIRGHEFHYSKLIESPYHKHYYDVVNKGYKTGIKKDNVIAGYPHILWLSNINYFITLFGGL